MIFFGKYPTVCDNIGLVHYGGILMALLRISSFFSYGSRLIGYRLDRCDVYFSVDS